MIIVDENAEDKLADLLKTISENLQPMRCIYLSLMDRPAIPGIGKKIVELAMKHFPFLNAQIFLCEDGDTCILAPHIPSKDGRDFIIDVASYTKIPANEGWVGFYELPVHINKVAQTVGQKLEKRHIAEMEKQKILEQQQHERKRQAILNAGAHNKYGEISRRRANRSTPELMMVEDDAFSRRLVENVLHKQYPITGLGEANFALDTYARLAPDLLFLDINLPDVTGHELLEKILAIDPDAYVVMLSGNSDQANIMQAMSKGAKGFIAKPFTRDKLFQYIERCPTINHNNQRSFV